MCDATVDNSLNSLPVWRKRDTVFAAVTLICSVLFVHLSIFGGFNAGFTASFFLLFALTAAYMIRQRKSFSVFTVFCGLCSLGFSVIFSVYNDTLLNILFFIAAVALYGVFVSGFFTADKALSPIMSALNTLVINPFDNITAPFRSYGGYRKEKNFRGINKQVLIGILLSVPVLSVVFPLLMSADAAFEGLILSVFSGFGIFILKILLGAAAAVYLFSMLFAAKNGLKAKNSGISVYNDIKTLPPVTAVTLCSVLSAVYLVYLLSQTAYFFSGFSGILPSGYSFTAAGYARRGFFELCGVCGMNFFTAGAVMCLVKRTDTAAIPLSVRATSTLICAFSLIFAATAISKMFLYIDFYGLTRLRLLTSIFMAAIALLFIIMILFMYIKRFPAAKCAICCFAVIGLITGFCDVDRTVASYNVNAYESGALKELDVEYLGHLSDSAVPYIEKLTESKNSSVSDDAFHALYYKAEDLFEINGNKVKFKTESDPAKYNYSRENARQIIKKNIKEIIKAWREREEYSEQALDFTAQTDYLNP